MKYLGIDYGTRRTGIAASDTGGSMAFPRRTLVMTTRHRFFAELLAIVAEECAGALVVGLPLLHDGTDTLTTRQVRNFVARLQRRTTLPVFLMEEFLSSHEAEGDLRAAGRSGKALEAVVDQQAAARILQSFLNLPESRRVPVPQDTRTA